MNKENKLGMGLGALLSTPSSKNENSNSIQKINISQIIPNPSQPRKNFKNEELKELSSSIKNQGLIQPIVVKPISLAFLIALTTLVELPEVERPTKISPFFPEASNILTYVSS